MDVIDRYVKELGDVLRTFNPNKMRKFIRKHRNILPNAPLMLRKDDRFILGMMSKMVCARTDMSESDVRKAKAILDEMG